MFCINNTSTDIYFNLAAEEYLLKNFSANFFMLWQNEPSVVIGKYQNPLAEADFDFLKNKQILFARRLTGGGAVYHDAGNLNFTFIESDSSGRFDQFSRQIVNFLSGLGIPAESDERNNLWINGLKISGSAQCIHKNRTLHHGTLLFSSHLDDLYSSLHTTNPVKTKGKYVSSVRSRVTNIREYLKEPLSVVEFKDLMMRYFFTSAAVNQSYVFNDTDFQSICRLREEKYISPNWNFK